MKRRLILAISLLGSACLDNPPAAVTTPQDTGSDTATRDAVKFEDTRFDIPDIDDPNGVLFRTPQQDGVVPEGHPEVDTLLPNGIARAGILDDDAGFKGIWAHCKSGDFKLFNSHVEFCIQGVETNRYEFFKGGLLVDARRVGDTQEDDFDVISFRKDLETFAAESVYVVRDGSDGRTAVIRADGIDLPIAHFVGALGEGAFPRAGTVDWTVEYRLRPDQDYVEIVTWISAKNGGPLNGLEVGDVIGFGDRFSRWTPGAGFDVGASQSSDFIIGVNRHQALGWFTPNATGQFSIALGELPWFLARDERIDVPEGTEHAAVRWLAIGDSVNDIYRIRGEVTRTLDSDEQNIIIRSPNGAPISKQLVEVFNEDGEAVALTESNLAGVASFAGPVGTYTFRVDGPIGSEPITVTAETPTELVVPTAGGLDLTVDVGGSLVVASVEISNATDRYKFVVNPNTPIVVPIAAGQYRLVVEKGMEYDFFATDITVTAGQTTKIPVTLNRVLDTTNYVAGDFHQHLEPSIDSGVHVEDRVLDNLAQEVEFLTPTDHEVITDLQPYIDALGFEDALSTAPGIEVSPIATHFNLFPMPYLPNERARGSIPLAVLEDGRPRQRTIPEMLGLADNHPADPVVQINHGRGSSGFFDTVQHDPATDPIANPHPNYAPNYDAMEVLNDWSDSCKLFEDWASHLNVGAIRTATGNSDSHGVFGRAGYPRTYLHIPNTEPGAITDAQVKNAMLSRQISVSGNTLVDFTDGVLPGDIVSGTANVAKTFNVRVQTPPYSRVERLLVIVNGEVVDNILLNTNAQDIIDFDGPVTVTTAVDAWVTFVALGPDISGEVHSGRHVWGFPNAVILDVDGDNTFTPPGPKAMDLSALNSFDVCN